MTGAHYLSMTIIGVGSFGFGVLPVGVSFRVTRSCPLFLSLILCFGTGVLLATSLVHMLTEVQTKLKLTAQLYFCAGFLILYTFDEITHFCLGGERLQVDSTSAEGDASRSKGTRKRYNYGAVHNPDRPPETLFVYQSSDIRKPADVNNPSQHRLGCNPSPSECRDCDQANERDSHQSLLCPPSQHCDRVPGHVDAAQPSASSHVAGSGLLFALLVHSILEGISIGVQTEVTQILLILGAVSFHKFVLSFCLGLELHCYGYKLSHLLVAIFLFSVGSPIGILVGMSVTSFESGIFSVDAQLQAVAAGSLLYVAAFEVLPRERFRWQHDKNRKAGICQLIFLLIGFMSITAFHIFVAPPHDHDGKQIAGNATKKLCW